MLKRVILHDTHVVKRLLLFFADMWQFREVKNAKPVSDLTLKELFRFVANIVFVATQEKTCFRLQKS